ncbi:PREDICTED: F-box protein At3g58530 isoform X3 [Tarenaya hassleriana]|uniref:F-box protein At3g58530 isoform X3 n=1 Tax=Tarenaya hassleriana TaxID=28532 RepID=UPI00053C3994|nr:PREDICTED: F-box protein At3g58530 isoform X3 [Tarenaya hassleriana]
MEAEKLREEEEMLKREIVLTVMKIVSTRLPQRDLVTLLLVSPWLYRTLVSYPSIWLTIDLREMTNAGDRLLAALSLPRYRQVKQINLEFAQGIDDKHLELVKKKNLTDKSMQLVAETYQELVSLNLTRCVKITDDGLLQVLLKCSSLLSLNLYALSSFTDKVYRNISLLANLRFLDLCGAQNLSDEGLALIAKCDKLVSLNLTWCVRITDSGVIAIANSCTSLEFLSLFGIVGVTDKSLETLSKTCSNTITTLDVNGCIGIKRRSHEELLQLFPRLTCFKVHS